jgi:hypothetical protein
MAQNLNGMGLDVAAIADDRLQPGLPVGHPMPDAERLERRKRQRAAHMLVGDHEPAPVDWTAAREIRAEHEALSLNPGDPQIVVAAAINDVIELARAMSALGLDRGVVEMRRRLAVMDMALVQAERVAGRQPGDGETVQ